MKKIIMSAIALIGLTASAQKADVTNYDITVNFNQPEAFKNFKTISYELQDDGEFWNHEATNEYPTLTSTTQSIEVPGLETVTENADLNFVVAFKGGRPTSSTGLVAIEGTYHLLLKTADNQIIKFDREFKNNNVNASEYKFSGSKEQQKRVYAQVVTNYANRYINEQSYLISGQSEEELVFGVFKKTKDGAAAAFTETSTPLISNIIRNPSDTDALDKAITYWKSQISVDFGKKVKDKVKNKVIYANLTSASILKGDYIKAKEYAAIIKENTGLFDLWTTGITNTLKKTNTLESFTSPESTTMDTTEPDYLYNFTFRDVTYQYKEKDPIEASKIVIERLIPSSSSSSGIVSLDKAEKPEIHIYENDVKTLRHFGDGKNDLKTKDGKHIIFDIVDGRYVPFIEQADGSYKIYQ